MRNGRDWGTCLFNSVSGLGVRAATPTGADPEAFTAAVLFYAVVISAMVLTAWSSAVWVAALGAMSFAASDRVLGHQRFVGPLPGRRLSVIVPYHVGQALLIVGLATA